MRDNPAYITPYRIAIVTLDSHNARPCERALENMCVDYPGIEVDIFAAATWSDNPNEFAKAKQAIERLSFLFNSFNKGEFLNRVELNNLLCEFIDQLIFLEKGKVQKLVSILGSNQGRPIIESFSP